MSKHKHYGEMFMAARAQLGINQTDLARELQVSQSAVSKLEANLLEPSAQDLIWLVTNVLQVNILEHLEAGLVAGRQELYQRRLAREHGKKLHKKTPNKHCKACLRLIEVDTKAAEEKEAPKRAMWARVQAMIDAKEST